MRIIVIDSKLHKNALKNVVTYVFGLNFVVMNVLLYTVTSLKVPAL